MGFRLALKSVTLNYLEWRNNPNLCVILPNSVAFRTDYITVAGEIHRYFLRQKCRPKNQVFSDISLMAILAGDHPYREG